MTDTEFHEECGMPASMHSLVCPQVPGIISPESLRKGPVPETIKDVCGIAIGAATLIRYGPGYDEAFDSESASNILDWMLENIDRINAMETSSK